MNVTGGSMNWTATMDYSQLIKAVHDIEQRLSSLEGSAEHAGNALDAMSVNLKSLLSTAGVAAFAKQIFDVRSSFEDAAAAMKVFTKDAQVAEKHLEELQKYAWYNVFEYDELVEASKQLQAYGTKVEDVIPVIEKLSNVAAAAGGDIVQFTQMYNKAKSIGKLDARAVAQFAQQGFVIRNELALMGETVSGTSISFEQFSRALDHATSEGGTFAGLMNEQFNNLSSLWGAVQDSWTSMLNEMGEGMQDLAKGGLKTVNDLITRWHDVADVLVYVATAYGTYRAALMATTLIRQIEHKGLITDIRLIAMYRKEVGLAAAAEQLWGKAKVASMMTNVYAALAAAIAMAIVAIVKYARKQNELRRELNKVDKEFDEQREAINSDLTILGKLEKGTEEYNDKLKDMTANYPSYIKYLKDEKGELVSIEEARRKINEQLEKERLLKQYNKASEITQENLDKRTEKVTGRIGRTLEKSGATMDGERMDDVKLTWLSQEIARTMQEGFLEGAYQGLGDVKEVWDGEGFAEQLSKEGQNAASALYATIGQFLDRLGVKAANMPALINQIVGQLSDERMLSLLKQLKDLQGSAGKVESDMREEERKRQEEELLSAQQNAPLVSIKTIEKEYKDLKKRRDKLVADIKKNGYKDDIMDSKGNIIGGSKKELEDIQNEMDQASAKYESLTGQKIEKAMTEAKKRTDEAAKAVRELKKALQDLADHEYDVELDARQRYIDNLEDGFEKEQELRKLAHDRNISNIERWGREEVDRYTNIEKAKYLKDNPTKNEEDFYRQFGGLSPEDMYKIQSVMSRMRTDEDDRQKKESQDLLDNLLKSYGDYTLQKEAIDEKYYSDMEALENAFLAAKTEGEKQAVLNAMVEAKNVQAKSTFNLDLDTIDATAYKTVEERMKAINEAYEEYERNLGAAGATEAEIAAVEQERIEMTGRLATLYALQDELQNKISNAISEGNNSGDEYEGWIKDLKEVIRLIKKITDETDEAIEPKGLKSWSDFLKELKGANFASLIDAGGELGDMFSNIGDAAGNDSVKGFGEALSFAGSVGTKIASGDYLGAALEVIIKIGTAIADDIAQVNAFTEANKQATIAARQIKIDNLLTGENGIFGSNAVQQVANYLEAMDLAKRGLGQLGVTGTKTFKVLDRSGFINFFGGEDQFSTLANFARRNGMELYDAYGNVNAELLQLFKDTYAEIDDEGQQWLDNAIRYTEQYAEAMEGIASYLESVFGSTVDTMVDQLFEGSLDMKAIISDVGKTMAKDLMKSAIMSEYFGNLKEDITDILKQEGGMTKRAAAEIFGMYTEAMSAFENDLPQWQNLMQQYQEAFNFDTEAESIGPGTALSSVSQESIDMMTGQINAMRTVQGRMDNTINAILLEMRGLRGDINKNHGEAIEQLKDINYNTSQSGLVRSLGVYFG